MSSDGRHEDCIISINTHASSQSFHDATYSKLMKEQMEKLIALVRENPCLYHQSCQEFKVAVLQYIWE